MTARLVPACLIPDPDDFTIEEGVSVFLESVPTTKGWQINLYIIRGDEQVRAEFSPRIPSHEPIPPVNVQVQLLSGVDDAMAAMVHNDVAYEALFSRNVLEGLVNFTTTEPRLRDLRNPSWRFYDNNY